MAAGNHRDCFPTQTTLQPMGRGSVGGFTQDRSRFKAKGREKERRRMNWWVLGCHEVRRQ